MDVGHVSAVLPAWSSAGEDRVSDQSASLALPTHGGQVFKCLHLGCSKEAFLTRTFTQWAKPPKGSGATLSSNSPVEEGLSFQERVSSSRL